MKTYINFGGGVNSTAIIALIKMKKLNYDNCEAIFADTGAERSDTYDYIEYIKTVSPIPIITVKSKEGSLKDYCKEKKILPMRLLRWCSQRWKHKPLEDYKEEGSKTIIGIDFGEAKRAARWRAKNVEFPLIDMQIDRGKCIEIIKEVGWRVPRKSGCFFCPFAKTSEFAELKSLNPELFKEVCEMEEEAIGRLKDFKAKGWFNEKYPLNELIKRKHPETEEGQMCLFCMD